MTELTRTKRIEMYDENGDMVGDHLDVVVDLSSALKRGKVVVAYCDLDPNTTITLCHQDDTELVERAGGEYLANVHDCGRDTKLIVPRTVQLSDGFVAFSPKGGVDRGIFSVELIEYNE